MKPSFDSLSVVVPVRDEAAALPGRIARLLEILPEMTPRFEIVVVESGSRDHSDEVAADLARHYPQVRAISQARPLASEELWQVGLQRTLGDFVIVLDQSEPIRAGRLHELWQLRAQRQIVMAGGGGEEGGSLIERLRTWAARLTDPATSAGKRSVEVPAPATRLRRATAMQRS